MSPREQLAEQLSEEGGTLKVEAVFSRMILSARRIFGSARRRVKSWHRPRKMLTQWSGAEAVLRGMFHGTFPSLESIPGEAVELRRLLESHVGVSTLEKPERYQRLSEARRMSGGFVIAEEMERGYCYWAVPPSLRWDFVFSDRAFPREFFCSAKRAFFDWDGDVMPPGLIAKTQRHLQEWWKQHGALNPVVTTRVLQRSDGSTRAHVVLQVFSEGREHLFDVTIIPEALGLSKSVGKGVDMSLYNDAKQLRLPGCIKLGGMNFYGDQNLDRATFDASCVCVQDPGAVVFGSSKQDPPRSKCSSRIGQRQSIFSRCSTKMCKSHPPARRFRHLCEFKGRAPRKACLCALCRTAHARLAAG